MSNLQCRLRRPWSSGDSTFGISHSFVIRHAFAIPTGTASCRTNFYHTPRYLGRWFAALERLPASVAAIGTMLVPVIGVTAEALALGEPLGPPQIAALACTVAGVALAARS